MKQAIILLFSVASLKSYSQQPHRWTALVLKKGEHLKTRNHMASVNDQGFYLYRNCMYDIEVANKRYGARLIDIKKDSLIFTSHFNKSVADRLGHAFDTLILHPSSINRLFLITDRTFGIYKKIALSKYEIIFNQDSIHHALPVDSTNIYAGDSNRYALVPYLTDQGLNWLYEQDGRTYYFMGIMPKPQPIEPKQPYKKRSVSLIPTTERVGEIKGLAIGFAAWPDDGDSLKISGVCIELSPLGWFVPMFGSFLVNDDQVFSGKAGPTAVKIEGFNLNVGGAGGDVEISGMYLSGAITMVNKLKGISITGVHTIAYEFKGVCISGLRNQTKKGRGVQIGLFNSSKNFKGIQVGLWNKNKKRALPFLNWNF